MTDPQLSPPAEEPLQRLGSGRAAEVFAWPPDLVLKLARNEAFAAGLQREADSLTAAHEAGVRVPKPRGIMEHGGRRGLLMERVDGRDIFSIVENKPWKVWSLASLVGRLHVELSRTPAPGSVPGLIDEARRTLASSTHVPEAARPRLLAALNVVTDGDRLCHLDFHPGNVMLTQDGPYIIDFPNAVRGPAIADHAKSWVILSAGAPTPGMGPFVRFLILVFRGIAKSAYMRAYQSESVVDRLELARWKAIMVGLRLDEGINEERRPLLRMLSRTLREAGV